MNRGRSNKAINVPNILTLGRLLLTPLFVIFLLRGQMVPALAVFTLAGISDGLDGCIARWFNQRTVLGAYLDPIADKVLLVSAFVCLAILGSIPEWLAVIVLSRDILIVIGIAVLTLTEKPYRIRPSLVSKCTTVAQLVLVFMVLLAPGFPESRVVRTPLVWLTAALTMISGFHYLYIGMHMLNQDADGR